MESKQEMAMEAINDQPYLEDGYYDDVEHTTEIEHEYMAFGPTLPPPNPVCANVQESDDYLSVIGNDHLDSNAAGDQTAIDVPKQQPKRMRCYKKPPCWSVVVIGILLALVVVVGIIPNFIAVFTRLNMMDSRLDEIETAMTDMKDQSVAMGLKLEPAKAYKGCQDALRKGLTISGVYNISIRRDCCDKIIQVYCEQSLAGGGWTVFQARKDGSVDFYRTWREYTLGFGELTTEFWLGNDYIYELSKHKDQELKIELTSCEGEVKYADHSSFWIEDEAHQYRLHVSGYSGGNPPGDSLSSHNRSGFTTKDRDTSDNCAAKYTGAWWFEKFCHHTNLNGLYGSTDYAKGMTWYEWRGNSVSMKATRMLMRKKS